MPGDHGELSDEERETRWAMEVLDAADPNYVRELILKGGMIDRALELLKEKAKCEDPLEREIARAFIEANDLGLLLADETGGS